MFAQRKLTLKRQSPPPIPELTAAEAVIQQELRIESQESLSTDADLSSSDNKSKLTRAGEITAFRHFSQELMKYCYLKSYNSLEWGKSIY